VISARFPDGAYRDTTEARATYRLDHHNARTWTGHGFTATAMTWQGEPIMEIAADNQIVAYLDHMGDGQGYAGGTWRPNGVATAYTARKDGEALVIVLWDVDADVPPGPLYIEGIDGA